MAVTINGKTYKGKYKGPDKFKGDEKKIAAYKAAKKKAATPAAAAPATSAATTTTDPVAAQSAANPASATVANSSGTIQLQSNYDIDLAETAAYEAIDTEIQNANLTKAQAELTKKTSTEELSRQGVKNAGSLNSSLAYRGMTRGTTAMDKQAELAKNQQVAQTGIDNAYTSATAEAQTTIDTAAARRAAIKAKYAAARQSYTDAQSKANPTEGSSSEDSGMTYNVTSDPEETTTTTASTAATKTYKGKYPGPDKFKGDAKKIAAWKAAKKKAKK